MIVRISLLSALLFGAQDPPSAVVLGGTAASSSVQAGGVAAAPLVATGDVPIPWIAFTRAMNTTGYDPTLAAAGAVWLSVATEAALHPDVLAAQRVLHDRDRFAKLVKLGRLEKFDDAKQSVKFKRGEPADALRDPGPLEDEATASAARNALAPEYAKSGLKLKLTCSAGKVTIDELPNSPVEAAVVFDLVLALDGVRTAGANLPVCLRLP